MNPMVAKILIIVILMMFAVGRASANDELSNREFTVINAANGLADNSAQTLVATWSGRMIITTIGHVNFYDGNSFSHVNSDHSETYRLNSYEGNYHTYFDNNHHFWLKDKHKLSCVDLLTEQFVSNISSIFKAEGVNGKVDDLFTDSERRLWLVSRGRLYGDKSKYSIPISQQSKLQDLGNLGDKLYLFYSDSKIEVYDLKTCTLINTAKSLDSERAKKYNKTTMFLFRNNGFFQLRSGSNISVLTWVDAQTLRSTIVMEKDYFLCNLAIHDHVLYVASAYGYWTINLLNGERRHCETLHMDNGKELSTDINAIVFDNQGGMWIGTEQRGLLYSKPYTSPFVVYNWLTPEASQYWELINAQKKTSSRDANGEKINCTTIDSRGWKWQGLMNGIKVSDRKGKLIRHIGFRDGMLNEVAHSIVEDNNHNMWVGTSNGIVAISVSGGSIGYVNSFNSGDGIPAESFKNGKAMKLSDGSIVMQAVDHVVKFNPDDFHTMGQDMKPLTAKFVKLMVNGVLISANTEIEGQQILDRVASQTKEINLNYDQNFINMTFSGLNYFRPLQTYYRYRVVGYDDTWRTTSYYDEDGLVDQSGLFHLPLPGLDPGHYVVEIQASMYPDQWEGKVTSIRINVFEPWWRATLTYILAAVAIVVLLGYNLFGYVVNYKLKLEKQSNEQMVIRQLKMFLQRSEILSKQMISHNSEQVDMPGEVSSNDISSEFVSIMMKISYQLRRESSILTVAQLSATAGLSLEQFHKIVAANINKSPRVLDRRMRMKKACNIMRSNPEITIGEVATMVNFASANFFIATFYRQYKITPKQYRSKMTAWNQ